MKNKRSKWKQAYRLMQYKRVCSLYGAPSRIGTPYPLKITLKEVTDFSDAVSESLKGYVDILEKPKRSAPIKIKGPTDCFTYKQFLILFGDYTKVRYSKRRGCSGIPRGSQKRRYYL